MNNKEYLDSRIEWLWKYRQRYTNRLSTNELREEYINKIQNIIEFNISTYKGSYDIKYCCYCYMPLPKDSVSAKYGQCGYDCPYFALSIISQ